MPARNTACQYGCHWDYVPGPHRKGVLQRTMMFICEYPYRTMLASGPCEDCRPQERKPPATHAGGFIEWIAG